MRLAFLLSAFGIVLATSGQVSAAGKTAAAEPLRVENSGEPLQGVDAPQFKEVWRLDDDDVFIGLPTKVLVGDDGNSYILDMKLLDVKIFDPKGDFVGSLGHEGEGPGEFRNASEMVFLPNGSIGVGQAYPARIVTLNLDGSAGENIKPLAPVAEGANAVILARAFSGGGNLVLGGMDLSFDRSSRTMRRRYFVRRYDVRGNPGVEYFSRTMTVQGGPAAKYRELDFDFVLGRMAVGDDGRVYIAPDRNQYVINVYSPDGRLERVIAREFESWPRNNMAKSAARNLLAPELALFSGAGMAQIELDDLEPDIEEMRCASDGSLWVLTSRSVWERAEGVFSTWDVFSQDGKLQKQVEVRISGNPVLDQLVMTDEGYVLKITNFLDRVLVTAGLRGVVNVGRDGEQLEVVCYKAED